MQFSLRTIFIIITTVAVYTAAEVALYQSTPEMGEMRALEAVVGLPLFVLWIVAACWVFQHRRKLEAYRLVLVALLIVIGWKVAGEIIYTIAFQLLNSSRHGLGSALLTLSSLFYDLADTASWALVLLAYIRANKARQVEPTSPWLPDEPATSER
jgi:hypothetical protein